MLLNDGEKELLEIIDILKDRVRKLERSEVETIKYFEKRLNRLEKSINIHGFCASLGIFFAFLLIGHLAKWI